jgi:hypothetical protein
MPTTRELVLTMLHARLPGVVRGELGGAMIGPTAATWTFRTFAATGPKSAFGTSQHTHIFVTRSGWKKMSSSSFGQTAAITQSISDEVLLFHS